MTAKRAKTAAVVTATEKISEPVTEVKTILTSKQTKPVTKKADEIVEVKPPRRRHRPRKKGPAAVQVESNDAISSLVTANDLESTPTNEEKITELTNQLTDLVANSGIKAVEYDETTVTITLKKRPWYQRLLDKWFKK